MSDKIIIDGQEYNLSDFNNASQQASRILNDSMPAGKIAIYYEIDGKILRAKFGLKEDIQIAHSEVIDRIYIEILIESGTPKFVFIGCITNKVDSAYTEGMVMRQEYTFNGTIRQIWINKDVTDHVTVHMPNKLIEVEKSGIKDNLSVKSEKELPKDNLEKTDYGYRRLGKRFDD